MDTIPIGYKAICEKLKLNTLPHYRESYIALHGRGKTINNNHHEIHIYPKSYALRNEDDLLDNLEFALKHDGMNFEIIKSLFERINKAEVVNYILRQPLGIYSRKIWFLYEFLMDDLLDLNDCQRTKYINLLDSKIYFTGNIIKSPRHAINNNLLGNNKFCPFIRKTEILSKFIDLNLDEEASTILKKYDPLIINRASNYLYTKETMSSYQIEREQPDKNRVIRFINILQHAASIDVLTKEKLIELQNIIVDPRFQNVDYRHNQNYVAENLNPYFQKVHYISPKPDDVIELMQGLLDSLYRMLAAQVNPVIIAAAISFGFVFIHPFEDGNGRLHRFLIHYILSKQQFTPKDMIFPISAIMLKNIRDYDMTLESFSKPLLTVLTNYHLSEYGVMEVKQDTHILYKYIDFTVITEYLFTCIKEAIYNYFEREIEFLIHYDQAKKAIRDIVDMPDNKIDLFIKCVMQNQGKLSAQKQERFFAFLTETEIQQLTKVVQDIMISNSAIN